MNEYNTFFNDVFPLAEKLGLEDMINSSMAPSGNRGALQLRRHPPDWIAISRGA